MNLLAKGEERHKKNSGGQSLANSFWQREKGIKDIAQVLFSRFGKPENFRKLFAKEEEEEIQEDVQRDSKVVKDI